MKSPVRLLVTLLSAALLAACGGQQPSPAMAPHSGVAFNDHVGSNVSRAASPAFHVANQLLYVSDPETNDVYIRTYPRNKTVATLYGFENPQGLCSDKAGNVWVANMGASNVLEYAHDGTSIATLDDPGQLPISCAIDAKSGDLAVVNFTTTGDGTGSISIYKKAAGKPVVVTAFKEAFFDGYDRNGNLFADGLGSSGTELGEIVKGTSVVSKLSLKGATINYPGGIQYALGGLAVGDQEINGEDAGIYQVVVSGSIAQIKGTVQLINSHRTSAFVILGNAHRIICADTTNGAIPIYNYPAGGDPIKTLNVLPQGDVSGLTISQTPPP